MKKETADPIRYAREVVGKDPMARHLGIEVLESKINFLNGVSEGTRLEAVARPVERKRTIGLWNVEIRAERAGLLVAACQGLTYHTA
jgi:acyl-coenzyme A thioesterase PaaI-like protein